MSKLNSEEDRLYKDMEKMFGVYQGKLAKSFQELSNEEENLNERFQKVFLEYKKRLENEFNEIGEGTESYKSEITKTYEECQIQAKENTQKLNQDSKEIFIDLNKKIDITKNGLTKIYDLINNFDQIYKDSVSGYMSKLNSEEDRLYKDMEKMFGVYQGKLAKSFQELNKEEENLNERFQKVFLEYKKRLENKFNEIGEGTESYKSVFIELAETWKSKIETIAFSVQDNFNEGKFTLEKQESEIMQKLIENSSEFIESEKDKFNADVQNLLRKFQKEAKDISFLKSDLETKQANLLDTLKEQRKALENELKTVSYEQLELLKKKDVIK